MEKYEQQKEFYRLYHILREELPFDVFIEQKTGYLFGYNELKHPYHIGFCTPNSRSYRELSGNICVVDVEEQCWSDSAIILPIPKNDSETSYLLQCISDMHILIRDEVKITGYCDLPGLRYNLK